MKSTLEQVLQYRNEAVVHRFMETWALPLVEAQALFTETLKWLWLGAYVSVHKEPRYELSITQSLRLLDEMWHTFILFTRDYTEFCERFFGFYVHHKPSNMEVYEAQMEAYARSPEQYLQRQRERFLAQCELILEVLGEQTLEMWFSEYLERYDEPAMMRLWRWSFSPHDTRKHHDLRLTRHS